MIYSFERYVHVLDFTRQERAVKPQFLEGTGSLVLDRVHHVAYVALSERSDLGMAQRWASMLDYKVRARLRANEGAGWAGAGPGGRAGPGQGRAGPGVGRPT